MQIKIKMELDTPLELPISYNYLIQSWIYSCISEVDKLSTLHDSGWKFGERDYKLFTFGMLEGPYRIVSDRITFFDSVSLEIRVTDKDFSDAITKQIDRNGIVFGKNHITKVDYVVEESGLIGSDVIIRMKTPIVVYHTSHDKHTIYLKPNENDFYEEVAKNAYRKHCAVTNEEPVGKIELFKIDVRPQDKVITKYKGFIIEGYKGTYRLNGDEECLQMLYTVGIGSKNSQGFGMFDIVK